MLPADWTLVAVLAIAVVILFVLTFQRRWLAGEARRFARRVGLDLPAELAGAIEARLARRNRASLIGAIAGAAGAVALRQLQPGDDSTGWLWLLLGATFTGFGIGITIAALTERPAELDGTRVARADAVGLPDYVAPFERNGARVVVAASVIALLGMFLLGIDGARSALTPLSIAIVAIGILSLVVFEIGSRRIVGRGRAAGSTAGLAWDDALRAGNARDLVTAPICLGLWGTLLLVFGTLEALPDGRTAMIIAALIAVCGALVVAFANAGRQPQRHFLRRLWPDLAATGR